ncbi:MAG: CPBP family intramembrane metalloprotease [Methylococcaceae bacterium]|nr:CPBP family intramembrane metalloprotease [Methylococcaceae bacterium]
MRNLAPERNGQAQIKLLLGFECLTVFFLTPWALAKQWLPMPWIIPLLAMALIAAFWLRRNGDGLARLWRGEDPFAERAQLRLLLLRWLICTLTMMPAAAIFLPEQFLFLPTQKPGLWGLIMLLYPLLSVLPQEIIYRAFFFRRYAGLFTSQCSMMAANALAFGWLHLIFGNTLAVVMTLLGGWWFAATYCKTRSLRLVCLEHSLYGMAIFTLGLGTFFYRRQVLAF